jgi:hypothetical protein
LPIGLFFAKRAPARKRLPIGPVALSIGKVARHGARPPKLRLPLGPPPALAWRPQDLQGAASGRPARIVTDTHYLLFALWRNLNNTVIG